MNDLKTSLLCINADFINVRFCNVCVTPRILQIYAKKIALSKILSLKTADFEENK